MSANISTRLSGNSATLEVFGQRIGKVGSNATLTGLARSLGDEALFQVQIGFVSHTDPYGHPWAAKVIPDGRPPLEGLTGKLRAGWRIRYAGPDAVTIGNNAKYAKFQLGTGIYGPTGRPIVPKRAKMLSWKMGGQRFFFRSVRGAPPRLMVPQPGHVSTTWLRALTARAREYMRSRLAK